MEHEPWYFFLFGTNSIYLYTWFLLELIFWLLNNSGHNYNHHHIELIFFLSWFHCREIKTYVCWVSTLFNPIYQSELIDCFDAVENSKSFIVELDSIQSSFKIEISSTPCVLDVPLTFDKIGRRLIFLFYWYIKSILMSPDKLKIDTDLSVRLRVGVLCSVLFSNRIIAQEHTETAELPKKINMSIKPCGIVFVLLQNLFQFSIEGSILFPCTHCIYAHYIKVFTTNALFLE